MLHTRNLLNIELKLLFDEDIFTRIAYILKIFDVWMRFKIWVWKPIVFWKTDIRNCEKESNLITTITCSVLAKQQKTQFQFCVMTCMYKVYCNVIIFKKVNIFHKRYIFDIGYVSQTIIGILRKVFKSNKK